MVYNRLKVIKKLKKNIVLADDVLKKIRGLNTYTYLYQDQANDSKKTLGFMAQDVEPLFPELVEINEDGFYGLNYDGFGVVAIKAIQEQQKIIETQQSEIDQLKNEINAIKAILQKN